MLALFLSAFLLGLVFNATPGAVFAETVRQGVRGGYRAALSVQAGSLVGDALWAVLGLLGIGLLMQLEWLRWPVAVAGIAYLLWLARDAWRAAGREFSLQPGDGATTRHAWRAGISLSITNPQNVAYWAAVGSAMGAVGVQAPTPADYGVFLAGFMASSVLWCFFCAAVVDRVFKRAGMRWARVTYKLCALAFLALALGSVRDLTQEALRALPRDKPAVISRP